MAREKHRKTTRKRKVGSKKGSFMMLLAGTLVVAMAVMAYAITFIK